MIGILVLFGAAIYLLVGLLIIVLVAKSTKGRIIGIIILALIPTWDVIVGYPTFWYLCKFKSGVKIYKTVENVEGFYVGEKPGLVEPLRPYSNYRYTDYYNSYKKRYYRSYWLDNTSSDLCYQPKKKKWYQDEFDKGRCLARKELQIDQLSQFELKGSSERREWKNIIPLLGVYKNPNQIIDRKTGQVLGEQVIYNWNQGWLNTFLTDGMSVSRCTLSSKPNTFRDTLELTLKPVQGVNSGNDI